jgi:hypothetical protein
VQVDACPSPGIVHEEYIIISQKYGENKAKDYIVTQGQGIE